MSFLDSLLDVGKAAVGFFTGNSIGSQLAKTALTGYALNKISNSINKQNDTQGTAKVDPGVRLQVDPDPEYSIPLVYGTAFLGGAVIDAVLSDDNKTMWYVLAICEKTGNTNLGAGPASTFTFNDIYWQGKRIVFDSTGTKAQKTIDASGNECSNIGDLVEFYCYSGGSAAANQVAVSGYTLSSTASAYSRIPTWDSTKTMNDLVFAIVKVTYDAPSGIKGLADVKFKITNSMSLPGDVLYDYMTNTRYGAGIDPSEIYSS